MLFAKYNLFAKLLVNKEIVLGRYKGIFIHWEQYRYRTIKKNRYNHSVMINNQLFRECVFCLAYSGFGFVNRKAV